MSANHKNSSRGAWLRRFWLVVAVILITGGTAFLLFNNVKPPHDAGNGKPANSGNAMTAAECEQLTAQLNMAVGNLESDELKAADEALSELAKKFPNEPAAVRNLAICRVLELKKLKPEELLQKPAVGLAVSEIAKSVEAAKKLEPQSPIPYILAANIANHQSDASTAIAELEEAAKLAPHDAAVWYSMYDVGNATIDDALRKASRQALAKALEADPTNSYLLKQQLVVHAEQKDRQILETLAALRKQVASVVPAVEQKLRVDLGATAEQLKTAVEEEKWPLVLARSRLFDNALKPEEWVRSDLRRLNRHLLAYVVLSFSPEVCGARGAETIAETPRLAVTLQALSSARQFPELAGVKALNLSDFDLDGTPDVIALTENELAVMSRVKATSPWEKTLSVAVAGPMNGLLVADLDRDENAVAKPIADLKAAVNATDATARESCQPGDVEPVVFGPAGVQVFRNDVDATGKRTLVVVEQNEAFMGLRNVLAGVLADIDHDGDLDLILSAKAGLSIWSNQGQLKFEELTKRSALPSQELAATALVAVDWDRDLDIDIVVSGPTGEAAGWLENLRHGSMRWRPFEGLLANLTLAQALNIADVDGNASWDVIGTGSKGARLVRTSTKAPGLVEPLDELELTTQSVAGSLIGDFDNNTVSDLVTWDQRGITVYWSVSGPRFESASQIETPRPANVVACCAADMDDDGDLDLVVAETGQLVLYENDGGNKNHWLAVKAMGKSGDNQNTGDVNHLGIGSVLELKAGRQYQAQVILGQVTHFGLGTKPVADVLRVIWTNGVPQPAVAPKADFTLCRIHAIGTSCPYFYTWNGSHFEFCTDACWAAPLGLQLAEGVVAEPRAWEYLMIPGDRLQPKDGKYLIQMTEELWEASYLDQMELIVVDHPADVSIFSNEKVGPPELAEFKIHTVRDRKLPLTAQDKHGRDVLQAIAHEDGVFMKGFDAEPRRGLTDEHYLELDLGPLAQPKSITLFLTGWLYPASTSLRMGVSQDPSALAPRPPAIAVPDEHGNWQVVRPFMGFPGGRTKTIAVDLSGVFLTDDYRVRILTNMEFCWDAAFFSVDEAPTALALTKLPVAAADLHYRGYSAILPNSGFGPDGYDYNRVTRSPKWAPMAGRFTRYGNVTKLLQAEDDLQVIFGSGDEITVAFSVTEKSPPAGWKRDFLLHNVGWDKDNDLNVLTSQAVEPLPFHGMSGYPYRADEAYPDTPRHRDYLHQYQTRTQSPLEFWRQVQLFGRKANSE